MHLCANTSIQEFLLAGLIPGSQISGARQAAVKQAVEHHQSVGFVYS